MMFVNRHQFICPSEAVHSFFGGTTWLATNGDVLPGFSYAEEDKDSQEIISVEMDGCPRFNDCANNGKIAADR